jgi:hypothetical protein
MQGVIVEFQQNRRATNVYLRDSEEAARGFFSDELVDNG